VTAAALLAATAWVAYALGGPRLARRLRPPAAARALVFAALVVAASSLVVLGAVAATWIGQLPEVGRLGWWSAATLRAESPIPRVPAIACAVLVCLAVANLTRTGWRRVRVLFGLSRCCRELRATDGVILLDSERRDAFTTTPPNARIVVTTGLLDRLSADEGRALFAHERSHLDHRHGWWILTADLAAAVNPLLVPTAGAVRRAVERWADEDAARVVGDRGLVARSLARTALLVNAPAAVPVAAASGGDVGDRVRAMLGPPPRTSPLPAAVLAVMLLLAVVASGTVPYDADLLFDRAGLSASASR
jgi:Zn-dependent protease with chaperone function